MYRDLSLFPTALQKLTDTHISLTTRERVWTTRVHVHVYCTCNQYAPMPRNVYPKDHRFRKFTHTANAYSRLGTHNCRYRKEGRWRKKTVGWKTLSFSKHMRCDLSLRRAYACMWTYHAYAYTHSLSIDTIVYHKSAIVKLELVLLYFFF